MASFDELFPDRPEEKKGFDDLFPDKPSDSPAPKAVGKPQQSLGQEFGRAAVEAAAFFGKAAHAGLEGAVGVPTALNTIEEPVDKMLDQPGLPGLQMIRGLAKLAGKAKGIVPALDAAIGAKPEDFAPTDDVERYALAGARGAGAGAVMPFGGPALAVGSGITSGLAAEGAHDLAPDSKMAPIIAGAIGGGLGGGAISAASRRALPAIAARLGESQNMTEAGVRFQDAARGWVDSHPQLQNQVWAPIDAAVPGNTRSPLTSFTDAMNEETRNATPLLPISRALRNTMRHLQLDPTWENMARVRTQLGEELATPNTLRDQGQKRVERLYGALTDDMRGVAHTQGVGDQFDQTLQQSQRLFADRAKLAKLYDEKTGLNIGQMAPEKVAENVVKSAGKGGTDLGYYRGLLGDDVVNELAAAHLNGGATFHRLHQLGQEALIPDGAGGMDGGALRQQAINASRRAAGPRLLDEIHGERRDVRAIALMDFARAGAEMAGVSPGGATMMAGLVPSAMVGLRKAAGIRPAPGQGIGGLVGAEDLPPLTVRPRKRDGD